MHILQQTRIGGVKVGTTSTQVVGKNGARIFLAIFNPSDTGVFLNFGADAEANKGGYLGKGGGSTVFTEDDFHFPLEVYAITASGEEKLVTYIEGF